MNNHGQAFFLTLMIGVCIIIIALAFAPVINEFNDDARNTTASDGNVGLDCANTSISDFQNAACIANDITTASFVGILLALGLAIIVGKVLIG